MEMESQNKLDDLEKKIDAVYVSVEKTRKYFLTIIWIMVVTFVLPLIAMAFAIPKFINTYLGSLEGLI